MSPESIAGFRIPKDQVESLRAALADAAETRTATPPRRLSVRLDRSHPVRIERRTPRRAA